MSTSFSYWFRPSVRRGCHFRWIIVVGLFVLGATRAASSAGAGATLQLAAQSNAGGSEFGLFEMGVYPSTRSVCTPSAAGFFVDAISLYGFSDPVTLVIEGLPPDASVTVDVNPVLPDGHATFTIQPGTGTPPGVYEVTVVGVAPVQTEERAVEVAFLSAPPLAPTLRTPFEGVTGLPLSPQFSWNGMPDAALYELSIATDPAMTNEVAGYYSTPTTSVRSLGRMLPLTTHYWAVRGWNACGFGAWSAVRSFTTGQFDCNEHGVEDIYDTFGWRPIEAVAVERNLPIPDCDGVNDLVLTDSLVITECAPIADLDVTLDISHSWAGDLVVRLTRVDDVSSTTSTLVSRIGLAEVDPRCSAGECCGLNATDLHVRLDDSAFDSIESASVTSGLFRPSPSPLADFDGHRACGTWTLEVSDNAANDVGTLVGWGLHIKTPTTPSTDCDSNEVPDECDPDFDADGQIDGCDDDIDGDSVPNARDVCDYTPPGLVPDINGTVPADLDGDCDVDLADAAIMLQFFTGPWR